MLGQACAVLIFWVQGCLSVLVHEKKLVQGPNASSEVFVIPVKKGRTQPCECKNQNEAQEYLPGWKNGRAQAGLVQGREGGSGVFVRVLHKERTQPGSVHVLRC